MPSSPAEFFLTKRSLSEIKAELLPAYFPAWAETATGEELILADLNTGFDSNGASTAALKIRETFTEGENATKNEAKTLKLFLGDASKTALEKLKQSLETEGEEKPQLPENTFFLNDPETQETLLKTLKKVPALLTAEPFSSEAVQETLATVLKRKATDLFLLFEIKKLEKTFLAENPTVFLSQLFGSDLPAIKAQYLAEKSPKRREQFLLEQLENGFRKLKYFPLSFRINPPSKGNSAILLLAGKTKSTYFRAKEWLQSYSDRQEDGVPLFGANLNYQPAAIPGFSDFLNKYSLRNLTQELAGLKSDFHYQTIRQVYESHSPGTGYVLANYLAAFRALQQQGNVNLVDAQNKKVPKVTPEAVVFYRLHTAAK